MIAADGVERWLRELGLAQYADLFRAHEIDSDLLPSLTDRDLEAIGVRALGHRKKLLQAIAALVPDAGIPDGSTVAAAADVDDLGHVAAERRQLTVMFVDLVGSTTLSGELDPEALRALLHAYEGTVAAEIARFDGHIAQYLGDGVLAYFGWPRAHEDDAERAIRAGLAVIRAMTGLAGPGARALQARVGIATGLVVVGDPLDEGQGQRHVVVGETPNLAAGLDGDLPADERQRRLAGSLTMGAADASTAVPLIAGLLGLAPTSATATPPLTPQRRRQLTLAALIAQLAGLATRMPVLWFIDDAHWTDPTTQEILLLALDRAHALRVLILLTARPEFSAPLDVRPATSLVVVNRLGREASEALIVQASAGSELPTAGISSTTCSWPRH